MRYLFGSTVGAVALVAAGYMTIVAMARMMEELLVAFGEESF